MLDQAQDDVAAVAALCDQVVSLEQPGPSMHDEFPDELRD